jgi:uncharacterized protein YPO0396
MQKNDPNSPAVEGGCSAGFRLQRVELLNWGTFDKQAEVLTPLGEWSLLVGDNGCGKSTAIDAIRTLLVPPALLSTSYNDASGDGRKSKDRTRRSYLLGAYGSTSQIDSTTATTQFLRKAGELSAVLAVFAEKRHAEYVTLAQILWLDNNDQIREIFAICRGDKNLKDLSGGQTTTVEIKRFARQTGWELFDSYPGYAVRMRKLLNIPGERALEVFNRAMGMKEVVDIDEFIRKYLLPSAETFEFIRDTIQPYYRTVMDCWMAIDKADRQLLALRPVSENAERIFTAEARAAEWRGLQECVKPYFLTRYLDLLTERSIELGRLAETAGMRRDGVAGEMRERRSERDELIGAISATDVGPRVMAIDREIEVSNANRQRAQSMRSRIQDSVTLLSAEPLLAEEVSFINARPVWEKTEEHERQIATENENKKVTCRLRQETALSKLIDSREELVSTERNKVNIPRDFLSARRRICEALGVDTAVLPFVGELIEVKLEYAEWAGVIERLLWRFGVSVLVPDHLYHPAGEFINQSDSRDFKLKLTYYPISNRVPMPPRLSDELVCGRLAIRTEHPLHGWVAGELARRFNHRCCDTIAQLERAERGVTQQGLMRDKTLHVKDNSRPIDDLSNRILGWSTERKIAALKEQIDRFEKEASAAGKEVADAANAILKARSRAEAARELLGISDFLSIDPAHWSEQIVRLQTEKQVLESGSQELAMLRKRKGEVEQEINLLETKFREADGEVRLCESRLSECEKNVQSTRASLDEFPEYAHDKTCDDFTRLSVTYDEAGLGNPHQLIHNVTQSIQGRINNETGRINEASNKMTAAMGMFLVQFPEFGQMLSTGREYAESFLAVQRRIEDDDLPQYRERFEHYLNENLVGNLFMLNQRLEDHGREIEDRVSTINQALEEIPFDENVYVQLNLMSHPSLQINEFRRALRDCFEYGIAPGQEERARLFERVRVLIEKFQADPKGTEFVTDVRNWYRSGIRQLWCDSGLEKNYFDSSTGRSGGQKARLAFTILASALSAQYGLSLNDPDSPNFRLVVIDEAFSRTDERQSQLSMKLFADMGFQLLIVAPLDSKAKLAVPFVRTIHLAANPDGDKSQLMAITQQGLEARLGPGDQLSGQASVPALREPAVAEVLE